jgi:hypothetical protein
LGLAACGPHYQAPKRRSLLTLPVPKPHLVVGARRTGSNDKGVGQLQAIDLHAQVGPAGDSAIDKVNRGVGHAAQAPRAVASRGCARAARVQRRARLLRLRGRGHETGGCMGGERQEVGTHPGPNPRHQLQRADVVPHASHCCGKGIALQYGTLQW